MTVVQSVRGMRDVLPEEARRWHRVEDAMLQKLHGYAYEEIHIPLLESTDLFQRSVGEATDIVENEMYNLNARDGESMTLRPEGTAGCARALSDAGLLYNQSQRVFYRGPMFRYERPQRGRYRQFYQIGAEAFGLSGPDIDAELIQLGTEMWRSLGVDAEITLELNTIGTKAERGAYLEALVAHLTPLEEQLDEDSQRRLSSNPMRILDSKSTDTQRLLDDAPVLADYLDPASVDHYEGLKSLLEELQIAYTENPRLVRGLDYYTNTVFEWTTGALGAQGTICAGGRYDGLVEVIGGKPTPAAGFAIGVERVLLLHEELHGEDHRAAGEFAGVDVYCCVLEPRLHSQALSFVKNLRDAAPELRVRVHAGGGKLKNQLKRADQSGAHWALLFGEEELQNNRVAVKHLRETGDQVVMELPALVQHLKGEEY